MSEHFFTRLESFSRFSDFTDSTKYKEAPDDWDIIFADITGSTKAIEAGKYRDVNRIGAMAIVAVKSVLKSFDFPFVFGGDGATFLIPHAKTTAALNALAQVMALSEKNFGLDLRVGHLPVKKITQAGAKILVSKMQLAPNLFVAMFAGGGLTLAEKIIKNDPDALIKALPPINIDLSQLSCRWNPIKSTKGKIISLIITEEERSHFRIIREIATTLQYVLLEDNNPVKPTTMSYKSLKECIHDEKKYHDSVFSISFILRLIEILFSNLVFKHGMHPIVFNRKIYADSMRNHSDYRKFDDTFRLVLDCSLEDIDKVKAYLQELKNEGKINYGIHISDTALMTCVVENTTPGNHIHFVDGGDGGYAKAAQMLKNSRAVSSPKCNG